MKEIQGENFLTVSEVAKILQLKTNKNKFAGRTLMYKILRNNKILCEDNTPKQSMLNLGLATVKVVNKQCMMYTITLFSEKGLNYLKNGFESGKFTVNYIPTKKKKRTVQLDDVC